MTLKTVATALGVSPSTVSNAYNRPDQLSATLRAAVLAKAAELGYPGPDAAGRALRSGRTGAVGVILTSRLSYAFSDPYAVGFLRGLTRVLERADTAVNLLPLGDSGGEIDVRAVRQAAVDAVVSLSVPASHPSLVLVKARQLPLVLTQISDDPGVSFVAIDDVRAGERVGQHLRDLGHRVIGVVVDCTRPAGSEPYRHTADDVGCTSCTRRLVGLRRGLPGAELVIVCAGHNATASGRVAAEYLLAEQPQLTAIVGMSDVLCLGVIDVVAERGRRVPDDISVVGFDDIPAAAPAGLTTVRQPIEDKGERAGELVLQPQEGPRHIVLDTTLVVRSSTGAPRDR